MATKKKSKKSTARELAQAGRELAAQMLPRKKVTRKKAKARAKPPRPRFVSTQALIEAICKAATERWPEDKMAYDRTIKDGRPVPRYHVVNGVPCAGCPECKE